MLKLIDFIQNNLNWEEKLSQKPYCLYIKRKYNFKGGNMIVDENITIWNGNKINIQVENRFEDTGEILIHFDDGLDCYTESLILNDIVKLRDKLNYVIAKCVKDTTQ